MQCRHIWLSTGSGHVFYSHPTQMSDDVLWRHELWQADGCCDAPSSVLARPRTKSMCNSTWMACGTPCSSAAQKGGWNRCARRLKMRYDIWSHAGQGNNGVLTADCILCIMYSISLDYSTIYIYRCTHIYNYIYNIVLYIYLCTIYVTWHGSDRYWLIVRTSVTWNGAGP